MSLVWVIDVIKWYIIYREKFLYGGAALRHTTAVIYGIYRQQTQHEQVSIRTHQNECGTKTQGNRIPLSKWALSAFSTTFTVYALLMDIIILQQGSVAEWRNILADIGHCSSATIPTATKFTTKTKWHFLFLGWSSYRTCNSPQSFRMYILVCSGVVISYAKFSAKNIYLMVMMLMGLQRITYFYVSEIMTIRIQLQCLRALCGYETVGRVTCKREVRDTATVRAWHNKQVFSRQYTHGDIPGRIGLGLLYTAYWHEHEGMSGRGFAFKHWKTRGESHHRPVAFPTIQ